MRLESILSILGWGDRNRAVCDDDQPRFLAGLREAGDESARSEFLRRHVERTLRAATRILDASTPGARDMLVMPASGFPEVEGLVLSADTGQIELGSPSTGPDVARLDCLVLDSEATLVVEAGNGDGLIIEIRSSEIRCGERSLALSRRDARQLWISVSVHRSRSGWVMSVSSGARELSVSRSKTPILIRAVRCTSGTIGLLQHIAWDGVEVVRTSLDGLTSGTPHPLLSCAPVLLREWEERARRLWHSTLLIAISCEALDARPELLRFGLQEAPNLLRTAGHRLFNAMLAHPDWRPCSGLAPSAGPWERGNWSNGFITGSVGVLTDLLADDLNQDRIAAAVSAVERRGCAWLRVADDGGNTKTTFPPIKHWLRRSTNHGIVILASAYVGVRCAARRARLKDPSLPDTISGQLDELLRTSFSGGVYPEGLKYAQFSLQEALAAILLDYGASREDWERFRSRTLEYMLPAADWLVLSAAAGATRPFANWGDCPPSPFKQSVVQFLSRLGGASQAKIATLCRFASTAHSSQVLARGEVVKTEPLLAAAACLPETTSWDETDISDARIAAGWRVFDTANMAAGTMRDDARLWVLGSSLHLTHSKDHDLGSFFLDVGGVTVIGEVPGRGADRHTTPVMLDGSGDAVGGDERDYRGTVSIGSTGELHVDADGGFRVGSSGRAFNYLRRTFRILGDKRDRLVVHTRARSASGLVPQDQVIFPAGGELVREHDSSWTGVSLPTEARAWHLTGPGELLHVVAELLEIEDHAPAVRLRVPIASERNDWFTLLIVDLSGDLGGPPMTTRAADGLSLRWDDGMQVTLP